ncbi:Imm8 family immunity protein [Thalassomonas actiniarum]|uniref:Uncharacterized protein n=1 Tax=Thalassomonas actiniarum TaxID=485447 RepID=A0AAE9YNP7_9GAMM|nr:Imm8 family immunity protein [Thalassomonas actiniarum]WDD97439.1 hypothetical protein SG35_019235 [Thalassomonas actiniarum]
MKLLTPEIQSYDCCDHDPIDEWVPEDPSMVDYWLNISVGVKGEIGSNNYQVHVVTQGVLSQIKSKSHLLILPYYEGFTQVLREINYKLIDCSDVSWEGVFSRIAKLYAWEYESYRV